MKRYTIAEEEPMIFAEPGATYGSSVTTYEQSSVRRYRRKKAARPDDDLAYRERLKAFVYANFSEEVIKDMESVNFMFDAKTPWDYDTETEDEMWENIEREEWEDPEGIPHKQFLEELELWSSFR